MGDLVGLFSPELRQKLFPDSPSLTEEGDRLRQRLYRLWQYLDPVLAQIQVNLELQDWARLALALAQTLLARFFDPANGGFWQSADDAAGLIVRVKEDYDGAEPGGNSVAVLALLELGKITGRPEFTRAAEKTLGLFAEHLEQIPQAVPSLLAALDFSLGEPRRFVLADPSADPENPQRRALLRAIHSVYLPNKVVLGNAGAVEPFARTLPPPQGAVVYPCTGSACQEPTSDPKTIQEMAETLTISRPI